MPRVQRKQFGKKLKEQVYAKTDGACWFCGCEISDQADNYRERANIDHLTPVCQGGTDELANLVPACFQCNIRKFNRNLEEFRAEETRLLVLRVSRAIDLVNDTNWFFGEDAGENITLAHQRAIAFLESHRRVFYGEGIAHAPDFYVI